MMMGLPFSIRRVHHGTSSVDRLFTKSCSAVTFSAVPRMCSRASAARGREFDDIGPAAVEHGLHVGEYLVDDDIQIVGFRFGEQRMRNAVEPVQQVVDLLPFGRVDLSSGGSPRGNNPSAASLRPRWSPRAAVSSSTRSRRSVPEAGKGAPR